MASPLQLQDVTPPLDVLAGRESGYELQRLFSNAKTPYKTVSPATHGYQTDQARKRAGRTSLKNTYEPRSAIPNSLVLTFGTDLNGIEKAGWFSDLGTFDRHYEKVSFLCWLVAKHCLTLVSLLMLTIADTITQLAYGMSYFIQLNVLLVHYKHQMQSSM